MLSVPNGATSRRLQLPYELAYGLQKLERLVVHIVKRIRHQEEDYLALHSSAADVSPAVAKLWASTWAPPTRAVRGGATPQRCFAWTTHTRACKLNKKCM